MGKVLLGSGNGGVGISYAAAGTYYSSTGFVLEGSSEVTEANTNVPFSGAGSFSNLAFTVLSNTVTAASTFRLRKNGSNATLLITIPSSTSGYFEDITNTDTIVANDTVNYQLALGATGTSIVVGGSCMMFSSTSNTLMKWGTASSAGSTINTASTTTYRTFTTLVINAAESTAQTKVNQSGTWQHLQSYISSNLRTSTTVIRSRINGSDGNQVLNIPALTTGAFEDTANTDTISAGSLLNYSVTTGIGTTSLVQQTLNSEFLSTVNQFTSFNSNNTSPSTTGGLDTYHSIGGADFQNSTMDAPVAFKARMNLVVSKLSINVVVNTSTTSTLTLNFRKNSVNRSLKVLVPAGTTGHLEDLTNAVAATPSDLIDYLWSGFITGGSMSFRVFNALFTEINPLIKTINGTAIGSLETYNGLNRALVKTRDGLSNV